MLKILHYISIFSQPSETFIYDLIAGLEKNKITKNYILSNQRVMIEERPFENIFISNEKKYLFNRIASKLFDRNYYNFRNRKDVLKYINTIKPDIIHSHFGPNGIRMNNLLNKHKIKIPQIISFHGMDINVLPDSLKKYKYFLNKLSKQGNVFFISPSHFLKNKMISNGLPEKKIEVIHNSFNPIFSQIVKDNYFKKGDQLKLLNIGRLETVKGQIYLIEALALILKEYVNVKLTIIGSGSEKDNLIKRADELGIKNKIEFIAHLPHEQLPKIISEHDIYIQPSIVNEIKEEENSPISVLEAMATGLPVIASNIGGLKEVIINNKNGFLVDQKNPLQISHKIFSLINSNVLYQVGKFSKTKAVNNFSQNNQILTLKKLYTKIYEQKNIQKR